ncbi:MAG: M23 family metallopeptidase [Saprospiraceae bacterium]
MMKKEKFVYNTSTLRYEKVVEPLKIRILKIFGFVSAVVLAAFIIISIAFTFFPSPKEQALIREIEHLKMQNSAIGDEVQNMSKVLGNIQDRDASVHRMMFGMEPIDQDIWNGGTGGHEKFQDLANYKYSGELLIDTRTKLEKLKRQLAVQSVSLDSIQQLADNKEVMLACIPAIKPVRSDRLARNIRSLSGYGMRFHPIWKRKKMHYGIDFTCPKGTPIQATGDGKIARIERRKSGYGNNIIIDHGYGFKTLYAHMQDIEVKLGQKVVRGQQIGTVGSSGTSTAPHLHYEVHNKGNKVDPIHYCMDGLSVEEYQELANMAAITNQSFD